MAGSDRWYFSKEVLATTPSRRCGIDADKELSYRQQAANLIQDMGQRLHVSQLCINTAIVYMHRFYTFHSFTKYHRNSISSCALFLAAKVEEQPRKLEHVIKVSHMCLHRENPPIDVKSEAYQEQAMELVFNENLMLQTLGFDIAVEHPHTSVVNCCQLVRASKDLAQTSYFMATNSLHLTTMCLQYKPTVVACVCIHLACKWSSWEIPRSSEGKDWFFYVDKTVTLELLERLTTEFLAILAKCPSRLKRKIMAGSGSNASAANASLNKSNDEKKSGSHMKEEMRSSGPAKSSSQPSSETGGPVSPLLKKIKSEPLSQSSNKIPVAMSYAAYRERKERDSKLEQSVKTNQSFKSLAPSSATRESFAQQKERPVVDNYSKMSLKQQQINIDKQKQIDERNKLKTKNPENLWDNISSNRQTLSSKPITSSFHQKPQNNVTTDEFYDNLVNKPSNFNSIFSTDGEDSLDFKKDITTDLKMEFSDNSNLSNDALNLSSFPSDFINDSSDSKKSLNNNNNNNSNNKTQTNAETKAISFTSIFSSPITANPLITQTVPSKLENTTAGIPSIAPKYNPNDLHNIISRLKPEPPPPMLSPLKSGLEIESVSKPEKQSFPSHFPSVATHLKSNQNLDSKPISSIKSSKTPPKTRNPIPSKHSVGVTLQSSPKEKEVNESQQNINLENNRNPMVVDSLSINNNNNNNIFNSSKDLSHSFESISTIAVKQENIEKSLKGAEVPSVLSHNKTQTSSTCNPELDIKSNIDLISNVKPTLHSSPPQKPINTFNSMSDQSSNVIKSVGIHNKDIKEVKEKSHEERHSDKHHKHSHHSHKSSKHKDKHKHKHKDKDREKHKRKDKDRDRERERDREKQNDSKEDPSYKLSWSSPRDKSEASNNSNIAPIKLKISKNKLSVDSPDKDNDVSQNPQNPLKLRIQLKDQKLTANATDFETNDSGSGRKRKSSPKSSKREKMSKYESNIESNNKLKEEKSSKSSSKSSKKSNDSKKNSNLISEDRYSTQPINSFSHQMLNMGIGQTIGAVQGVAAPPRSSKAHK